MGLWVGYKASEGVPVPVVDGGAAEVPAPTSTPLAPYADVSGKRGE